MPPPQRGRPGLIWMPSQLCMVQNHDWTMDHGPTTKKKRRKDMMTGIKMVADGVTGFFGCAPMPEEEDGGNRAAPSENQDDAGVPVTPGNRQDSGVPNS